MPDGISHAQERLGGYDRSPPGMPPAWVRSMLQRCAVAIREENMRRGRKYEVIAICNGLEDIAEGETATGCQYLWEAEAHRERGE